MKKNTQLNNVCRRSSVMISASKLTMFCFALFATASFFSCKKDRHQDTPSRVTVATGVRLVHSSFKNSATPVDLFIDDTKVTTNGTVAYLDASTVYPVSAGSHKISAKTSTGTVVADTTINIADATQYSFFIKDRAWVVSSTITTVLKTGFVAVPDNNTTPPDGMAKIRFVNASSAGLNAPAGSLSFSWVTVTGNLITSSIITQSLGLSNTRMYSEYTAVEPGTYTLRVNASTASAVLDAVAQYETTVTVEADKLYTAFGTSTQYTVKTPSKSPLMLVVKANN